VRGAGDGGVITAAYCCGTPVAVVPVAVVLGCVVPSPIVPSPIVVLVVVTPVALPIVVPVRCCFRETLPGAHFGAAGAAAGAAAAGAAAAGFWALEESGALSAWDSPGFFAAALSSWR